jgi:hypothetical protein
MPFSTCQRKVQSERCRTFQANKSLAFTQYLCYILPIASSDANRSIRFGSFHQSLIILKEQIYAKIEVYLYAFLARQRHRVYSDPDDKRLSFQPESRTIVTQNLISLPDWSAAP